MSERILALPVRIANSCSLSLLVIVRCGRKACFSLDLDVKEPFVAAISLELAVVREVKIDSQFALLRVRELPGGDFADRMRPAERFFLENWRKRGVIALEAVFFHGLSWRRPVRSVC